MHKIFVPRSGGFTGFDYYDGKRKIGRLTIISETSFAWVAFSLDENDRYGDASSLEAAEAEIGYAEAAVV